MSERSYLLRISNHDRDLAGLTYVYPVLSRRAGGVSVGVNLNPNNACNWHCVYCQVPELVRGTAPDIDLVRLEAELDGFLHALVKGDYMALHVPEGMRVIRDIAFSGNGEPTSAAAFPAAIDIVLRLRAAYGLGAEVPVRVITNGSLIGRSHVRDGLRRLGAADGEAWFKVDAGSRAAMRRINGAAAEPAAVARRLQTCAELCRTWVQTCMFRWDGVAPAADEIDAYLELLAMAGPDRLAGVLLYGIARPSMQPEAVRLAPLSADELEAIAARIREKGLTVRVSP